MVGQRKLHKLILCDAIILERIIKRSYHFTQDVCVYAKKISLSFALWLNEDRKLLITPMVCTISASWRQE